MLWFLSIRIYVARPVSFIVQKSARTDQEKYIWAPLYMHAPTCQIVIHASKLLLKGHKDNDKSQCSQLRCMDPSRTVLLSLLSMYILR